MIPRGTISPFLDNLSKSMHDESLIITEADYVGRCLDSVEPGDLVCTLLGCAMPMILPRVRFHHILIADVHLESVIHGKHMTAFKEGGKTLQDFELH